jgi:hypothetical protein
MLSPGVDHMVHPTARFQLAKFNKGWVHLLLGVNTIESNRLMIFLR